MPRNPSHFVTRQPERVLPSPHWALCFLSDNTARPVLCNFANTAFAGRQLSAAAVGGGAHTRGLRGDAAGVPLYLPRALCLGVSRRRFSVLPARKAPCRVSYTFPVVCFPVMSSHGGRLHRQGQKFVLGAGERRCQRLTPFTANLRVYRPCTRRYCGFGTVTFYGEAMRKTALKSVLRGIRRESLRSRELEQRGGAAHSRDTVAGPSQDQAAFEHKPRKRGRSPSL